MSNWIINSSDRYFAPLVECMRKELLKLPVTQADETPTQVINDGRHPGSKSYMWVHHSGEFCKDRPIVIYEYQKGREHELPLVFYQDYKGVLVTDGLQQYHLVEKKLTGLINANCWAHARRDYADAVVPLKSKTADGLRYSVNQDKYLRIFLDDGNVPIDNSASERAIRTFCIGKRNWMFHDSVMGAQASAVIYSLSETAKLNDLRPYYYFKHRTCKAGLSVAMVKGTSE